MSYAIEWQPITTAPKDGTQLLLVEALPGAYPRAAFGGWQPERQAWSAAFTPTHWKLPPPHDAHEHARCDCHDVPFTPDAEGYRYTAKAQSEVERLKAFDDARGSAPVWHSREAVLAGINAVRAATLEEAIAILAKCGRNRANLVTPYDELVVAIRALKENASGE